MEIQEKTSFESTDKEFYVENVDGVFNIGIEDNFTKDEIETIINILTEIIK